MKASVLVVLGGCLVMATCFGCHGIRQPSLSSEDPYRNVIVPKTDLVEVTVIDAFNRLMEIHGKLRKEHMDAEKCTGTCTPFPGLHFVLRPVSQGVLSKRLTIHLENMTMTAAFKRISSKFGLTVSHQGDSFKEGCFVIEDPNYKPEIVIPDDLFLEIKSTTTRKR